MALTASSELRQLDQVDYRTGIHRFLLFLAMMMCFAVAFLANFPIEQRIQRIVKAELSKLPGCNPTFDGLSFSFLLPKVMLSDVQIPSSCLGQEGPPVIMRGLTLYFLGPSFAPLGVALKVSGDINGQPLNIRYSTGATSQVVRIEEDALNLAKLAPVIPGAPKVQGTLKLDLRLQMAGQQVQDIKLLAESTNFVIPPQSMGDFRLPALPVGDLSIKAASDGPRKVIVDQFVLGKTNSPVRANFKGNVELDEGGLAFSPVDLKGEVAFSQEFLDSFAILNLMLAQFSQKDGFYQVRLGGTLGQIRPQPL